MKLHLTKKRPSYFQFSSLFGVFSKFSAHIINMIDVGTVAKHFGEQYPRAHADFL